MWPSLSIAPSTPYLQLGLERGLLGHLSEACLEAARLDLGLQRSGPLVDTRKVGLVERQHVRPFAVLRVIEPQLATDGEVVAQRVGRGAVHHVQQHARAAQVPQEDAAKALCPRARPR